MVKKNFKKNSHLFRGETNPFNIKINRKKHSVVGSSVKGTKGLPGISKSISQAKRKDFWHKSKLATQKSNHYLDKRLLDSSMPLEDQVTSRFIRERQKKMRKNMFNLNDEKLTHKGQSLCDIKDFGDNLSGSEEDEALGSAFVSKAHFGGFASESNFESTKSHKDVIEQMIMENKLKKQEVKIEKEKYINAQELIDQEWKEIHLISSSWISNESKSTAKQPLLSTKDVYDISKYELQFEPKSNSVINKKTPEEIVKEEKENKIEMEQKKLLRMIDHDEAKNNKIDNHLSADGIFDYLQPAVVAQEENNLDENKIEESDSDESSNSELSFKESDQNITDSTEQVMEKDCFEKYNTLTKIPSNIKNFKILVQNYNMEQVSDVVDNILKIHIKCKKATAELENFFGILLQYCLECCEEQVDLLLPHLHSLATTLPSQTAEKFLEYLNQEQEIFFKCKKQNKKCDFPRLQTLMILKFSSIIYSVSDFRHPIVTPAITFMCNILSSKFFNTYTNLLSRLFVNEILLDCIVLSKRFIPEAINFLNHILQLAETGCNKTKKVVSISKVCDLNLSENCNSQTIVKLNLLHHESTMSEKDKIVGLISTSINQLLRFASLYSQLPSYKEIFSTTLFLCSKLPIQLYPSKLQESIRLLLDVLQEKFSLQQLMFQNIKPKPLELFEPSFECKYNKKDDLSKKQKLLKQVSQKIKKEEKCLMREIRRNAQVVASERLKERLESDAERKRKVKEILSELALQEGEYKKMLKK